MRSKIRALVVMSAIIALTAAVVPLAVADKPIGFPTGPDVFWDVDPCTGQPHEITLTGYIYLHVDHPNNFVVKWKRFGMASSGYVMIAGNQHEVYNKGTEHVHFKDMWKADDGRKMEVSWKGMFNLNTGELKLDKFVFRCIGGETILP